MSETYKHPDGVLSSTELSKRIDWEKANSAMEALRRIFSSFGFTAPEVFISKYDQFVEVFNVLGGSMLLYNKTTVYEAALRGIVELDSAPGPMLEAVKKIAQDALDKRVAQPDNGEKLIAWLTDESRRASLHWGYATPAVRVVTLFIRTHSWPETWISQTGSGATINEAFLDAQESLRKRVGG